MKTKLILLALASIAFLAVPDGQAQSPAPSTPIPLVAPAAPATPPPHLNLTSAVPIPAATVQAALASLGSIVALPPGTSPAQIKLIVIQIRADGTAIVHVQ